MKKNIILITIDSLRYDCVGYLNKEEQSYTPNLDSFAKNSIVFTKAIAQAPYTSASFASLFTSKYPSAAISPNWILRDDNPSTAQILEAGGYNTAGFHSNPFLSRAFKYDKGFDTFDDNLFYCEYNLIPEKYHFTMNKVLRLIRKQSYSSASKINKKAISWLKGCTNPFFLWIHYMDIHGPYVSKKGFSYLNKIRAERLWRKAVKTPELITKSELNMLISTYHEEITYLDKYIGQFFKAFKELNLYCNTVIIICADHGDEFYEHQKFSHPGQLYDELIRIPLIIRLPNINKSKIISQPIGLIDVLPTIVDVLNLDVDSEFEGHSLLPLIKNMHNHGDIYPDFVISESTPDTKYDHICIRTDEWKFIMTIGGKSRKRELYNIVNDPKEQVNLVDKEGKVAKELETTLLKHYYKIKCKFEKTEQSKPQLNDELRRRLENLGYL